jgi:hypothetical protein
MLQDHYLDSSTLKHINNTIAKSKGLTQCDFGYVLSFDPKDKQKLSKFYDRVKIARANNDLGLKNELIEYYEKFLSRSYNDQTVCYEYIPEFNAIGYQGDRVVFAGLEAIADLVTGKRDRTFTHYGIGTGSSPVLPSNQSLDFEEIRVSISDTGFAESKGSSMVFAAYFPTTIPSMSVTESGIFDRAIGTTLATMLLRTVYTGNNIVSHIFNQTFLAVSHFVYQLSV